MVNMSDRGKLFTLLMGGLFKVISVILIVATIASLVVTFYYNHWMWWGRFFYILISIAYYIFIIGFQIEFWDRVDRPKGYNCNWALIVVTGILALHFGLAGLNCRPWTRTVYAVEHGKLAAMKPGVWWTNPFALTCLITYDPVQSVECTSGIFAEEIIEINLSAHLRPGVTIKKMYRDGFLPAVFDEGATDEDHGTAGRDKLQGCADMAVQRAIAIAGLTKDDLRGRLKPKRQQSYMDAIEAEVERTLPVELELDKGSKVSAMARKP